MTQTPAETVAQRVKELRKRRNWSARQLADRCAELGAAGLDRSVLANLESGRRRTVSIDEVFVLRKLQTALAPKVAFDELATLAKAAVLESYKQGDALFQEGDESNGLHLIRRGSVTVSRRKSDGEQVLGYLPAGNPVTDFLMAGSFFWLGLKIFSFLFLFLWFRATFPRYRYDQIMRLGWKALIPVTLVWIFVEGVMSYFHIGPWAP